MKLRYLVLLFILLAGGGLSTIPNTSAQEEVTVSLVIPEFFQDLITDEMIQRFEDANPGIEVYVKPGEEIGFVAPPAYGIEDYLDGAKAYASSGDVLFLTQNALYPEATRAGYLLDLKPLVQADASLNTADFYPVAWESYQWDNGLWAIPVSLDVVLLAYDSAAFDAAGLPYPNASWTMDDLANAARALTEYDSTGAITKAGLMDFGNYMPYLMRSLAGTGFYTDDPLAASPRLNVPVLESLLTTWTDLQQEGVIGGFGEGIVIVGRGGDSSPLALTQSFGLSSGPNQETTVQGSLLPGGKAGIITQGFAISSGTLYPEQAYKLVKFLSEQPEIANSFQSVRPARRSLDGAEISPEPGNGPGRAFGGVFSPETEALIDQAISNGLPRTEMRFADYLSLVTSKMISEGVDALTALQEVELGAITNLQTAEARRSEGTVAVATPVPIAELAPGEIALDFGIVSFISPLPNQEGWAQLASEFAASDPEVGRVDIDTARDNDLETLASEYECFYMPNNAVQGGNPAGLLDLTPFMRDDPLLDENDFIGNTLAQVQVDNKYWALPINLVPDVLNLNTDKFAQYGAVLPSGSWTIDQFVYALQTLKPTLDDEAPFVPTIGADNALLMLIAAYGGLPIDFRTSPPTINFTDPATVDAIRQVLDLAKAGYIQYDGLSTEGGGGAFTVIIGASNDADAISTQSLGMQLFGPGGGDIASQWVTYPRGSQYIPISYDMGTAYISATAQNPAACYRWLSTIARRQDLFSNMPVRHSMVNDPALAAAQGENTAAVYREIAALMEDPNVVVFPTPFGQGDIGNVMLRTWLNQAFDAYVLENADLAVELADAETYTRAFQECIAAIPPFDQAVSDPRDYFQQYMDCATRVDPTVSQ